MDINEVKYCADCRYAERKGIWPFRRIAKEDARCMHPIYRSIRNKESMTLCRNARTSTSSSDCCRIARYYEPADDKERTMFLLRKP